MTALIPIPDTAVHLSAAGVSVLLDVTGGHLPALAHWGAELGPLTAAQARAVISACIPPIGPNAVDEPVRVGLLPSHHTGFVGRPGLSGSRGGQAWSPAFRTTTVELDGRPVTDWAQGGAGQLRVTARDDEAQLDLLLDLELRPSGLLRTRASVTNTASQEYQLDSLTLAFPVPAQARELLDFAGRWGKEKTPQRSPFGVGIHLREGRRGRTGPEAAGVLHAGTPGFGFADGEIWGVHTGWSGNHVHYAELTFDGHRLLGGGELLLPGEIRLGEGESYTSPWVYGAHGVGLDAVARRFHRFLRARERRVTPDRPVTLNVWEAVYFDHDLPRLLDLAQRAAALGVERFVLDDGWFGSRRDDHSGLGDWVVSDELWPHGLHPLVEEVTGLGMQFGLWFEPEMVSVDSDVARAHPDWILRARTQLPVESRHQQVLDLANPAAYAHVRDQMLAILGEYDIAYLKWDHNRDLIEAGSPATGCCPSVHAQTAAYYRLLAELRAAHPALEIESCSSGGARVDLGALEHTDRVWVSDCIDPLERQSMLRWTAQLVPPEFLGSHIASGRSHTTGRTHDLNFRAATAIFGHLGIEWDLAQAGDAELAELGEWVTFYRAHRELLHTGDLVRIDDAGEGYWAHGVVAADRSAALFAYVTMANPLADPGPRLRLRGLDPDTTYVVRPRLVGAGPSGLVPPAWWGEPQPDPARPDAPAAYPGAEFRGDVLAAVGIQPPRVHPDQVVLVHVEAIPAPRPQPAAGETVSRAIRALRQDAMARDLAADLSAEESAWR